MSEQFEVSINWTILARRIGDFRYFIRMAWFSLCGKITRIEGDKVTSVSGYKYFGIVITKVPLSKEHEYGGF